jgi:hypothetical protein
VDQAVADLQVCRLKTVRRSAKDVRKSKSENRKLVHNASARKRRNKESTTRTNFLKVS